jgi:glycosyltransferase involved in cell wall biosynthesis
MKHLRVLTLSKRWEHHTASGGYDRLATELAADVVQRPLVSRKVWHRAARSLWRRQNQTWQYLHSYCYEDCLAEWSALARSHFRRPDVLHVLYGDEQMNLLLKWRSLLPCPLFASFHFPTSRVCARYERFQKHLLEGIDGAVVVSRCQLPEFRRWLNPERVVYVPHGIDTRRFSPGLRQPGRQHVKLVTVGDHMRDWEALHQIIDECHALPVQFDVIAREQYWLYLTGCKNVRLRAGIREDELVALYRQADALLLPMTDATANNAVLESLGCGTPVISNAVGGIPDYVDDSCGWLFAKGEVDGIVKFIRVLCEDKGASESRRVAARQKSLEFDWSRVVSQMQAIYKAVVDGSPPASAMMLWKQSLDDGAAKRHPSGNEAVNER